MANDLLERLSAEFPRDAIHWRPQKLTKGGKSALALAYLDSRDVQDRLDDVCGAGGWQSEHYDVGGKTACKIGVYIKGEVEGYGQWVWKSDGSGDTQIEAEKGAFSGSFKRAAVLWGIGRYLYNMKSIWASCETYENKQGKRVFKEWKGSPWDKVSAVDNSTKKGMSPLGATKLKEELTRVMNEFRGSETMDKLMEIAAENKAILNGGEIDQPTFYACVRKEFNQRKLELNQFEGGK